MLKLSKRLSQIQESQTVALNSVMADMRQKGIDVVTLGAGEPDFDTPPHIKKAAIEAINAGFTKYTPADGTPELKNAVSQTLREELGVDYTAKQIIITCGAKHAVYQAIAAVCDPGDEVILPAPYWVSYPEQIQLVGGITQVLSPTGENLKITAEQLREAITDNTKALILNSPSNPSGAVYSHEELKALAAVIQETGIFVISDEIYDKIVFDGLQFASMTAFPDIRDQLIYINGVSKSFAMTGWRVGFLAAHQDITQLIKKFQGHVTSNPASISQKAAVAGYLGDKQFQVEMVEAFQQRRDYVVRRLNAMPGVSCMNPAGAFYAFPDFSHYIGGDARFKSSLELCGYLLEEHDVAIVPGAAFGMDNHARLSYATSMEILEKALDRIESGLNAIGN